MQITTWNPGPPSEYAVLQLLRYMVPGDPKHTRHASSVIIH